MIGYIIASDGKRFPLTYLLKVNQKYIDEIKPIQKNIKDLIIEEDGELYMACTGTKKVNFIFNKCLEDGCTFKVEHAPKILKYDRFN
jgi:hypothetical protein